MKKVDRGEMGIVTERNRLLLTWINLHDRAWIMQHFGWLMLKLAGSAISLQWNYLRSFGRAVTKISKVRDARRIERKAAVISDRALADTFVKLIQASGIYLVKDEKAEVAFSEMKSSTTAASEAER